MSKQNEGREGKLGRENEKERTSACLRKEGGKDEGSELRKL